MKEKTVFLAKNGKMFDSKEECLTYENMYKDVFSAISTIFNFCKTHGCDDCPFCDEDGDCRIDTTPSVWEGLDG